jgi:L-fucose mutarotase
MLRGLDPLLTSDLLHALASMGHGDEIVIADANFPAASVARRLIPLPGADAPRALAAVLSVLPLDDFGGVPAAVMAVVGDPDAVPEPVVEFTAQLRAAGLAEPPLRLERHAFYARAREAFAVVRTGERRFYGNIILTKGVVPP